MEQKNYRITARLNGRKSLATLHETYTIEEARYIAKRYIDTYDSADGWKQWDKLKRAIKRYDFMGVNVGIMLAAYIDRWNNKVEIWVERL